MIESVLAPARSEAVGREKWEAGSPRAAASRSIVYVGALAITIFVVALIPRLAGLDLFPTSDEDSWMRRTGGFTFGLMNGQLGRTYQNGHPGVSTMWVAMLSQGPDGAVQFADRVHGLSVVGKVSGYLEGVARARVGFAVLAALSIALAAMLVSWMFGLGPAILAGLALAAEPFLIANGQIVHVDGPLTAFMTIAALAAIARCSGAGRWMMALCGVATGLALLSKSPALFLLAFVPLIASVYVVRASQGTAAPLRGGSVAIDLLLWAAVAAITVLVLWPAIWVLGPVEVLGRAIAFTRETGGQPDEVGSFFIGQVGADPGPFYYPVATLFRMSPFTLLGLIALVVLRRRLPREQRARAIWLAAFALGFAVMMTLGPKKFDRYLLPIFPALAILAAIGWSLMFSRLAHPMARFVLAAGLLALLIVPVGLVYPYPLSFYNPLLGGGAVAQRMVMVGNGEGLDQAAAWLRAQPSAEDAWTSAHSFDILAAMIPGEGEPLRDGIPDDADYIVTYGRRIQMRRWGPSLERYFQANPPLHTVWINGIEYVRIHPGPRYGRQA